MYSNTVANTVTQYLKLTREFPPGYESWATIPKDLQQDSHEYRLEHSARLVLACISKVEEGYELRPSDSEYTKVRGTSCNETL